MGKCAANSCLKIVFAVSPLIWIPQQLVGAPLGTTVKLQCHIESSPRAISYWDEMILRCF